MATHSHIDTKPIYTPHKPSTHTQIIIAYARDRDMVGVFWIHKHRVYIVWYPLLFFICRFHSEREWKSIFSLHACVVSTHRVPSILTDCMSNTLNFYIRSFVCVCVSKYRFVCALCIRFLSCWLDKCLYCVMAVLIIPNGLGFALRSVDNNAFVDVRSVR